MIYRCQRKANFPAFRRDRSRYEFKRNREFSTGEKGIAIETRPCENVCGVHWRAVEDVSQFAQADAQLIDSNSEVNAYKSMKTVHRFWVPVDR